MARILKQNEYDAKRNEILDYAAHLVYAKGYEQMTIQDLTNGLKISRGALYHYFDSKQTMLEALVDRMGEQATNLLLPIVNQPELTAIQKFCRVFDTSARWKFAQKELTISLMRIWYSDGNAIIRQKMTSGSLKWTAPLVFEPIIMQGIAEGVFTTPHPGPAARIIMGITLSLTDDLIMPILASQPDPSKFKELNNVLDAYFDAIERVLGAPRGSLKTLQADDFKEWWISTQPEWQISQPSSPLAGE
jgi:AcrR family transcriptional regulator